MISVVGRNVGPINNIPYIHWSLITRKKIIFIGADRQNVLPRVTRRFSPSHANQLEFKTSVSLVPSLLVIRACNYYSTLSLYHLTAFRLAGYHDSTNSVVTCSIKAAFRHRTRCSKQVSLTSESRTYKKSSYFILQQTQWTVPSVSYFVILTVYSEKNHGESRYLACMDVVL